MSENKITCHESENDRYFMHVTEIPAMKLRNFRTRSKFFFILFFEYFMTLDHDPTDLCM